MYGSSALFASTIGRSHTIVASVEVWKPGTTMGSVPKRLFTSKSVSSGAYLISGSVTINRSAAVRRTCSVSFTIESYELFATVLDPKLGYDMRLYRGVQYDDGTEELIPLGVFKLDTATLTSSSAGLTASVTGSDHSYTFAQNRFRNSFYVANAAAFAATIQALYTAKAPLSRWASTDLNIGSTSYTLPVMNFTEKDNPWASLVKIAETMEAEAFYDQDGLLTVRVVQDPTTMTPALDLTAGETAVRVGTATRKTSVSKTYNGVIVRASAPWLLLPVSGEAWDEDPLSPTYRYGPFGERPNYIEDAMVTTAGQANAVALARFNKDRGAAEEITFEMLPDPRLDVLDVASMIDVNLGVYDFLSIEALTIPLMSGKMTGTVRVVYRRSL